MEQKIEMKGEKQGVVICPGPNLAFFDKEVSLSQMVQHIYGNTNILPDNDRPNMFINELKMYVDHLKKEISDFSGTLTKSQDKKWKTFKENLFEGISYYESLFSQSNFFQSELNTINHQLQHYKMRLLEIELPIFEK